MLSDESKYARWLGARLRDARKAVRPAITQGDAAVRLAEILGESTESGGPPASRVSNYENGIRLPDIRTITALCSIYNCPVGQIIDDEHAAQTEQETKLLQMYRNTDDRGREQITKVAESQPAEVAC